MDINSVGIIKDDELNFIICLEGHSKTLGQCTDKELHDLIVDPRRNVKDEQATAVIKILGKLFVAEWVWRKNNIVSERVSKDEKGNFLLKQSRSSSFWSTGEILTYRLKELQRYGLSL